MIILGSVAPAIAFSLILMSITMILFSKRKKIINIGKTILIESKMFLVLLFFIYNSFIQKSDPHLTSYVMGVVLTATFLTLIVTSTMYWVMEETNYEYDVLD